ncbi:MAG TPA: DUF427 domain-containing protein [Allosphingosinicella sp.]|nr:DUF427 domain-containing protein [Allosphingosinicella sp.]
MKKAMKPDTSTAAAPVFNPGPVIPITIEGNPSRVVVSVGGKVIADTVNALTLCEIGYPPVQYIPLEDVDMSLLEPTSHATHCPYKGDAAYFSIPIGGERSVNAAWTYKAPYDDMAQIENHVAFYPDRVDAIEERPAR